MSHNQLLQIHNILHDSSANIRLHTIKLLNIKWRNQLSRKRHKDKGNATEYVSPEQPIKI